MQLAGTGGGARRAGHVVVPRLTEERGDQAAAALVESVAVLVRRLAREHGWGAGRADGGPGRDFGRTVNLAARIASRAGASQVLVSESVIQFLHVLHPTACASSSWGRYSSRGSAVRCGCSRSAGHKV